MSMQRMTIRVPDGLAAAVEQWTEDGGYSSDSEFVREAIRRQVREEKHAYEAERRAEKIAEYKRKSGK